MQTAAVVRGHADRPRPHPPGVEVLLATGDTAGAERAATELCGLAGEYATTALHAMAAHATGSVPLAEGAVEKAPAPLRQALRLCGWAPRPTWPGSPVRVRWRRRRRPSSWWPGSCRWGRRWRRCRRTRR